MEYSSPAPINKFLIPSLALAGMLLALWLAILENGHINVDAVLYLEIARRFVEGDWHGAMALYNWPLFPLLMAQVHHLTGLGVENAARLLTIISFGITTWAFLRLIVEAGGRRNAVVAGALLLFSSQYLVGSVLPMIMRDQGFWAFYLLSLLFFLRFYRNLGLADALSWQLCAAIATLFRVEAVSFIALLPLVLLIQDQPWRSRFIHLIKAYIFPLVVLLLVIVGLLFLPAPEIQKKLGRIPEMYGALLASYHQVAVGLSGKAHVYAEQVLNKFMADYAMLGLCLTLLAVLVGTIISSSGWLVCALAFSAKRCQSLAPASDARIVLLWAAGINLLNLVVILLSVYLIAGRYTLGLTFIILFFAAFSLAGLYEAWREKKGRLTPPKKLGLLIAAVVIAWGLINNLVITDPTYNYEQEAVTWLKQHTSSDARVYYDSARLRYYAQAPWGGRDNDWVQDLPVLQRNAEQFDYLVLRIKHRHPEKLALLAQLPRFEKVQEFKARNGDLILILAAKKPNP